MGVTVSLIGASARAAASSAWRAGWQARACDLFGDIDLHQRASCERPRGEFPRGLADFILRGPNLPWIYTGGLENHPALVEELARSRALWGNTSAALRAVRDPFTLGETLREGGFEFPESSRDARRPGVRYLVKPLRGSGGGRIDFAPESSLSTPPPHGHFYQRFRSGIPCSVTYVGARGSSRTLGATRQLIGVPWLHASPFAWCGNIGPIALRDSERAHLERLGAYLVSRFGLAGLFGVDLLVSEGSIEVVEVNPRYPASLEVLELATAAAAMPLHRAAFEPCEPGDWPEAAGHVVGKAVLFAPRRLIVSEDLLPFAATSPFDLPAAADLPASGTVVEEGHPVLTVYARGATCEECLRELEHAARKLERLLVARR